MREPEPLPDCPERQVMIDFDSGRLSEPVSESVAAHLSTCASCQDVFRQLQDEPTGDGFTGLLRDCLRAGPAVADSLTATPAAVKRLGDIDGFAPTASAGAAVAELPAAPAGDRMGERVGPYVLHGVLGRGGMGVVYRAVQDPLNRPVALKMIRDAAAADPAARLRFRTEGEAAARLDHPNVVKVYDFGESGGALYFAMEMVGGGSLSQKLRLLGPLPVREAVEKARALASALDYAHRRQVLHRDLKPGNVLLAADGTPKIADFGLAKLLDETRDGLTQTDAVLGTPMYMAPEQAAGRTTEVGPAADVYAVGAILYEALTGKPPLVGLSRQDTLRLVREVEPAPPSRGRPEVPRDLDEICMKCLEKVPTRRYTSGETLAEDLGRWLQFERPRHTPGVLGRAAKAVRRRKWAAAAVVGAVCAAGLAYARDPDRPLREITADLDRGLPVELIGETGRPKWSKWVIGGAKGQVVLADDGTSTVDTWGREALVELCPNPRTDRYRFAAWVRHRSGAKPSSVGLYVGRAELPGGKTGTHFLVELGYDDTAPAAMPPAGGPRPPNYPQLVPAMHSERGVPPDLQARLGGQGGPGFPPAMGDTWRELTLTVTPGGVTATWDGRPFDLSAARIAAAVRTYFDHPQPLDATVGNPVRPAFTPRGGLGICVSRGSASFRRVVLTPLPADAGVPFLPSD